MRKYLVRGPNNASVYIYSERNFVHRCLQEEDTPGKGFLWAFFGVHSEKKRYIKHYYFSMLHYLSIFLT